VVEPTGVLLVGVYGSGKTSVCEEMAEVLASSGTSYAAIDLDWLAWYGAPGGAGDHDRRDPVALANLSTVVGNYTSAGVDHFVLAGAVWSSAEVDALRAAVGFPLRVVQLTVPYEDIAQRLAGAVTTGRADDLEEARRQSERGELDISELLVVNIGPISGVADRILRWLAWTEPDGAGWTDESAPPAES
jgi:hypothetical protein